MIFHQQTNGDIREAFAALRLARRDDDTSMLDLIGASFVVTDETIFGKVNNAYVLRELAWYRSRSRNVYDIPGGPPPIWKSVASETGEINSNYGYLLFSEENGSQFAKARRALLMDKNSRHAIAVYTNPGIHEQATRDGMRDFICTNAVHYRIVNGFLNAVVQMRSNDAIFGFRNDYAWQKWVLESMASDLEVPVGRITWQAASLHIYPRHLHLVDEYLLSGRYDTRV